MAAQALDRFLGGLGIDESTQTTDVVMRAVPTATDQRLLQELQASSAGSQQWLWWRLSDEAAHVLALPVAASTPQQSVYVGLYIEVHSRLVAWWLAYAWRSRQLADATASLAAADQTIPAAACGRALLETAAAFWVDAQEIAYIWGRAKRDGRPSKDNHGLSFYREFVAKLDKVQLGGKFNDKAPDAAKLFERLPRKNVLTAIDRLAKVSLGDLQTDYQLLCNTVHPSFGTSFVFSSPPLVHETQTHSLRQYGEVPSRVEGAGDAEAAELSVPSALGRATVTALEVLTATLDAALKVLDDIALTTQAPIYADFAYWRASRSSGRNEPCACRSGKKTKHCPHKWGDASPALPTTFTGR